MLTRFFGSIYIYSLSGLVLLCHLPCAPLKVVLIRAELAIFHTN